MKTISVGELRQNPAQMIADLEAGEAYELTKHSRRIGLIVPTSASAELVPAKRRGGARTRDLPVVQLRTAASIDELIEDMKGDR